MITGAPAPSPTFLGCGAGLSPCTWAPVPAVSPESRRSYRMLAFGGRSPLNASFPGLAQFLACGRLAFDCGSECVSCFTPEPADRHTSYRLVASPSALDASRASPLGSGVSTGSPDRHTSYRVVTSPSAPSAFRASHTASGLGSGRQDKRTSYLVVASPSAAAPPTLPARLSRGRILLRRRPRARSLTACPRRRPRSLRRSAGPPRATAYPQG